MVWQWSPLPHVTDLDAPPSGVLLLTVLLYLDAVVLIANAVTWTLVLRDARRRRRAAELARVHSDEADPLALDLGQAPEAA